MATFTTTPSQSIPQRHSKSGHLLRLWISWIAAAMFMGVLAIYGFPYYTLSMEDRPYSPLHPLLRPSGSIGLKLGMVGVVLFFVLALYPLRKRWRWLSSQGRTPYWWGFPPRW
jgi:TRAP-type C4-dicarboxylate transport system permease small subunit